MLHFSEPQFAYLENEDDSSYFIGQIGELNDKMYIKILAHSRLPINGAVIAMITIESKPVFLVTKPTQIHIKITSRWNSYAQKEINTCVELLLYARYCA